MDFSPGRTPLLPLPGFAGVLAKLEMYNPTGSAKDRAALFMLDDAEARGLLRPGGCIIEPTSGNTGIALAALAASRGYRAILVMPDTMSAERRRVLEEYGAQLVLTPGSGGMAAAVEKARRLADTIAGSFLPAQFDNPANPLAHYCTTGPELWAQVGGQLDVFVCAVGTGGTLTGTGRFLREQVPDIGIVAVEPAGSPVLSGGQPGPHGLQGIGAGFVPRVLDRGLIDRVCTVTEQEAIDAVRQLRRETGILAGISSGAALSAARRLALEDPQMRVATILPDTGTRYLSMGLFPPEPAS